MKGWLDKYGKELNANEGSSSAPENWMGEGYSNVGRNYSPAWGGQFQMGGKLSKAQKGKKVIIDGKEYDTSSDEYKDLYRFGTSEEGKGGIGYFNEKGQLVSSHTTLPEVVIFPKDKNTQNFYDDLSREDQYAFEQLAKKYGPVNIIKDKGTGIFSKTAGHYNPLTDRITINPKGYDRDVNTYIAELAHKVQFDKSGKLDVIGDWIFNDLGNYITGDSPYEDTSSMEHEAHSKIEPELRDEFYNYSSDDLIGSNYNKFQLGGSVGGSLPGSVGFTYARTKGIPSNGPYAKKTLASAQNGEHLKNYLNKMNQDYKDWYSVDRGHDDGFDSFYYDYLQKQDPMITETRSAWELINPKYPNEPWYVNESDLTEEDKKRMQSGKLTGKFIKDYTTTSRDTSMDQYNSQLTKYLLHNNKKNSKQKNGGMTYYQHGLDWKPKSMEKGGWLDKYEVPKNQNAQFVLPRFDMPRAASESTSRVVNNTITGKQKSTATTGQKAKDIKSSTSDMGKVKKREEQEKQQRIAERKAAKAFNEGKSKTFTFPTGETKSLDQMDWREKAYVSGKSVEGKGRLNEDDETWYDDWINPVNWITEAAGSVGTAPYEAKAYDSNLPYVGAIASPLFMGRMMGSGSVNPLSKKFWTNEVSNKEFINNMLGGVPGMVKGAANKVGKSMESGLLSNLKPKYYKSAADRTWPMRFGETYSNVVDEYKALKKMHEISPENVIKPYDLKLDAEGNALGYKMQKFRGKNLNKYIDSGKEVSPEIKQQIRETVGKLHDAGLAHGDLFGNIMINNKGNKFKIIDPVGYLPGEIFPNFAEAKIEDLGILDELLGKEVFKQKKGGVIEDDMGQWAHPGEITEIGSNQITMKGVPYPVLGISDTGDRKMMYPEQEYKFKGKKVTEYPMAQNGRATRADSLALYNNAMLLKGFYDKLAPYYEKPEIGELQSYDKKEIESGKTQRETLLHPSVTPQNKAIIRANKDPNVTYLSDIITGGIDSAAPLLRYDKRIKPQGSINYTPRNIMGSIYDIADRFPKDKDKIMSLIVGYHAQEKWKDPLDRYINKADKEYLFKKYKLNDSSLRYMTRQQVDIEKHTPGLATTIPYYDPIAVKPFDLLTPQEKQQRLKTYGKNPEPKTTTQTTTKPQASLKGDKSKAKTISTERKTPSGKIIERKTPNVQTPPIQNLPYRVDYIGEDGKPTHTNFASNKEGEAFMKEIQNRSMGISGSLPGGSVEGYYENLPKKKKGGWLDKYEL